jgi:hypothetical protein
VKEYLVTQKNILISNAPKFLSFLIAYQLNLACETMNFPMPPLDLAYKFCMVGFKIFVMNLTYW